MRSTKADKFQSRAIKSWDKLFCVVLKYYFDEKSEINIYETHTKLSC